MIKTNRITEEEKSKIVMMLAENSAEAELVEETIYQYKKYIINKLNEDKDLLIKDISNGFWTKDEDYAEGMVDGIKIDIEIIEGE